MYFFGAGPIMIGEIKSQVTEASLSSLLTQVIQDSPFYLASNEQPQGTLIRTVSVEVRHSPPRTIPMPQPVTATSPR